MNVLIAFLIGCNLAVMAFTSNRELGAIAALGALGGVYAWFKWNK